MTDTAIVFVSGLAADHGLRVGGRSLFDRTLIASARAGVRHCFVVGATEPLAHDPRHPTVTLLPPGVAAAIQALHVAGFSGESAVVCLHANMVFQPPALAQLCAAGLADAPLVLQADSMPGAGDNLVPMAAARVRDLGEIWEAFGSADAASLQRLAADRRVTVHPPSRAFAVLLRAADDIPATERALLLALENPRDGRVDRLINRRCSRPLSRLFLRTPLGPNHITVLSFLVAVLGAAGFAHGSYAGGLVGALLFQLAAVLDCCDGEVARVKFQESKIGDVLDITLDAIANATIFAGIAWGAWATGTLAHARGLGLAAAAGILGSFVIVTYVERRLPEPAASAEHRWAQQLVSALTTRDFSVIVALAALAGALPAFLWGAAVGANVFWLLLLALVLRGRAARQSGERR